MLYSNQALLFAGLLFLQRILNMTEKEFMFRAIELAKRGSGFVNPNPAVGAVIVKDGKIIGEGYHHAYGCLHAERDALANLTEPAEGATIYVTLEPCCHHGKQPPCTEALIEHGIVKVVVGSRDPNPMVSGKGCKRLREHGIEVIEDFMREECDEINPAFFHYIQTGRPYVVMKYAMTLDGKIATHTGASKWITSEKTREHVHEIRGMYSAIMAGIGTVLVDDPMLNVRLEDRESHQPVRIIIDSKLRIPVKSNIVRSAKEQRTIIACGLNETEQNHSQSADAKTVENKKNELIEAGVEIICCPDGNGQVELKQVMDWMAEQKLDSVLIEGGGTLHEAAMRAGIVNHVMAYIAPKVFGGKDAKTPVEGIGVELPADSAKMSLTKITRLGEDVLLEYDMNN